MELTNLERLALTYLCLITLIIAILCIKIDVNTTEIHKISKIEKTPTHIYSQPLTIENVEQYILALNIDHPDIVLAQCKLESSHLKSKNVKNLHNLFGMTKSNKRATTAVVSNIDSVYSYYYTWEDSVLDYALWQATYAKNKTREEYFQYLGNVYATNPNYVTVLKSIIK